jgi:acetolactate synthase I/II/III large subunit
VTGAELLVETLRTHGARTIFSLSGNQILSIYDATIGRDVDILHTRHEAAATHMADGWGRLTESPGVALVTAGPGHLNAVSALYSALMAESPMVLLSGHAPRAQRGRGAFQEIDQAGAARPVVKAAWVAESAEGLGDDIARAFALATSGRPGPVHVSLPGDVLETRIGETRQAPGPLRLEPIRLPDAAVRRVLDLLGEAKRPLILLGPAMARPRRRVLVDKLAEITGVPSLVMESPRGVNDPALHAAAACLPNADLVLLLGKAPDYSVRFGEAPALAKGVRIIRIDVDATPSERIALSAAADPAVAAEQLASAARTRPWQRTAWVEEVAQARATRPPEWNVIAHENRQPIHPLRVCASLQAVIQNDTHLVMDGGEFGQWAQAGLESGSRMINGLSGSIGSAIPLALAAKVARPDRRVIAVLGDGTFGFHAMEMDTAVRYGLPIVTVVGNDARWNAEHQLQVQHYGAKRAVGCALLPTRYDRMVETLGGHGEHVERAEDLEPALARAIASGKPACVNVMIDGVPAPTYRVTPGAH